MYFPYLRGRQYELLALRELVNNDKLGKYVIPIIEPVKLSPTLVSVMEDYIKAEQRIAIIRNPAVGTFMSDWKNAREESREEGYKKRFTEQYDNNNIIKCILMQDNATSLLGFFERKNYKKSDMLVINNDRSKLDLYEKNFDEELPQYVLVPDERIFRRRVHGNKVLLDDKFEKQPRNADYILSDDEFFSEDHLYYKEDEYVGFSDYSVVGKDYQENGFAPYAVAIHIVYFAKDGSLRIKHFVSVSNEDIANPAMKFYEAVEKMAKWFYTSPAPVQLTMGLKGLLDHYENQTYPGLGTVKKLSIMHHIELVSNYLMENH